MKTNSLNLFIEINNLEFVFVVVDRINDNYSKIIFKQKIPIKGIEENKIIDHYLILKTLKDEIYSLEKKLNSIFKDVVLIIDNFDCSLISISGFKNLNGSQLTKENITYILNF